MSDEQKETSASIFGLDEEFKAPPASELEGYQSQAEPIPGDSIEPIIRDFNIGGQMLRFEAQDQEDLLAQVMQAQNEAFQRQMLLTSPQQNQIKPPAFYEPIPQPSTDELGALMLQFNKDPIGAHRKLTEWTFGMPFEAIQEQLSEVQRRNASEYFEGIGKQFVSRHQVFDADGNVIGGDFYACPENAQRMLQLLQAEGKIESPETYEYAYSKLKSINALVPYPDGYFDEDTEPQTPPQASTSLSGKDSYYPNERMSGSDEEFMRKARSGMSLDEIEAEIKRRNYAARR